MSDEEIRSRPIIDLLIDVAQPEAHEDSPERKAAWDEIKRRDAELVQTKRELGGLAVENLGLRQRLEEAERG